MYVPGQRSIFAAPRPAAVHIRTNFETKMARRVSWWVRPAAHRASCQFSILLRQQCIVMHACCGLPRNAPTCGICPLSWRKNTFFRRLDLRPCGTATKHPSTSLVGFRTCGSALATLLPPSTPDRAAGSEVPGSAGALVRFGAHSPPTRRGSCFMPRGTARTHLTTDAAILPTPRPFPSIEPGRTRMGDTVPISFSVVSGEQSD